MVDRRELPTCGAHPVARKYAGVLARGLRPRVLRTAGYTPGGRRREPGRGLFSRETREEKAFLGFLRRLRRRKKPPTQWGVGQCPRAFNYARMSVLLHLPKYVRCDIVGFRAKIAQPGR